VNEILPPPKRPSFEDIFMAFAQLLSERSTCRRAHVGCVIGSLDFRQVYSIGYNGNARGGPNDCDRHGEQAVGNCGCFVSGTRVTATSVERAYRRWYVGDVVRIVTRNNDFTVTPNHPILAFGAGFVSAESLNKGDNLLHSIGSEDVSSGAPHNYEGMPIDEVFETVRVAGRLVRSAGARHQFHGDGAVDQDVDVVSTDRGLRGNTGYARMKRIGEPLFPAADVKSTSFSNARTSFGSSFLGEDSGFMESGFNNDARDVQSARDTRSGFPSRVSREYLGNVESNHRLSLVPVEVLGSFAQHSSFAQSLLNSGVRDAERSGDVDHSLASLVAADEIVHIERNWFSGHVFNLQTAPGWYCAGRGNTIVQNCIHAEANAVVNCTASRDSTKIILATTLPCVACAKLIINMGGVVRVIYKDSYRSADSLEWFKRADIEVEHHIRSCFEFEPA